MSETLITAIVAGGLSGAVSLAGTVLALRVHFQYLRRDVDLAHHRIDRLQTKVDTTKEKVLQIKREVTP